MGAKRKQIQSFIVRDCALAAIATGRRAQNLRELRDHLLTVNEDSIYYHFWGGLLRPRFDDPEYNNDFAAWAIHSLHDAALAERLGIIDPTDFGDLKGLRGELIEVIEERLAETELVPWAKPDQQFAFIRSQIVVFNTRRELSHPRELPRAAANMSLGSIFFHLIDARRRTPDRIDDFRTWLRDLGPRYDDLRRDLAAVDPYFNTLANLRSEISLIFSKHLGRGE
ncbi:MAG: DUF5752 family protein [Candidatus Eisenbacteria bacterium]